MIDRSRQTAAPTHSRLAVQFKRSLRAGASVLALIVGGIGAGMVQPAFADPSITYTGSLGFDTPPPSDGTNWSPSHIFVGYKGAGSLDVRDGAKVTIGNGSFEVGSQSSAGASTGRADLTIDGKGSILSAKVLHVGYTYLESSVTVSNGGRLELRGDSNNIALSIGSGMYPNVPTAHLIVTGEGSSVAALPSQWGQNIYIGDGSPGDMIISDGGQVSGSRIQIGGTGAGAGSGTATISGQGSAWNGYLGVVVGVGGTGTLNIFDGGSVNDVSVKLGEYNAGVVNVGGAAGENAKAAGQLNVSDIALGSKGTLNLNTTDEHTIGADIADISGSGTINQIAGTTILTGDGASFSGRTNVSGGILQIGNGGTTGALGGTIINDAKVIFNRSNNLTYSGVMSGLGVLQQDGAGILTLAGQNTYKGGTNLNAGKLSVLSDANLGAATGALTFNGGILRIIGTTFKSTTRTINWGSEGGGFDIADVNNTFTVSRPLASGGALTKLGAGTLVLTGNNSYTGGTTVSGGILQLGNGTADGSIVGDIALTGSLVVDNQGATTLDGTISGTSSVWQSGTGMLVLSGHNSYGDTYLNAGVISVGQKENLGTGWLNFKGGTLQVTGTDFKGTTKISWGANGGGFDIADANNVFTLSNIFTGAGGLTKRGDGTLALSGDSNSFTGNTNVKAGTLRLDGGNLGTGTVDVASGASLGGHGTIGGNTTIADDGKLFGQTGSRLNFLKDLTLNATSNVDVTLNGASSVNELFHVTGNLTVNGTLSVNPNSQFGPGLYRIFQSDNPLTDNGMHMAQGSNPFYELQVVKTDGEVNLINSGGLTLNFWDGAGPGNDGSIEGGDGVWNGTNTNWTDKDGLVNGNWGNDNFAVFQGTGGTVTIENGFTPVVSGMQFFVDGYRIEDGTITLGGTENWIIVGNGDPTESHAMTATIASVLDGEDGLIKSGYGTLNLTGENTYSGTTTVKEGTLELSGNGSIAHSDEIVLAGTQFDHGDLLINKDDPFTLTNKVSGAGAVVKDGTGTTVFAGDNTFSGGLTVKAGTAQAGIADHAFGSGNVTVNGGATLDLANFNETVGNLIGETAGDGNIDLGSGTLTLNQDQHGNFSGVISGTGGLTKNGDRDLVLYGANDYSGQTAVNQGTLAQGAAGGFSSASSYTVANGASIELGGFDTTMAGLANSGTVDFGGTGGTTLNVDGDYAGNGGMLYMSAVLGGDDSVTDRMIVSGNTSGDSKVDITNRKGFGEKTNNGIEIIAVGGNSDGLFTLKGDYKTRDGQQAIMTDSAYAYTLQKGGSNTPDDGNWYLVSQYEKPGPNPDCHETDSCPEPVPPARFSAAAPVYESYTATLQALNKLPTLQQRVGERYLGGLPADQNTGHTTGQNGAQADGSGGNTVWGRIEGAHNRLEIGSTAGVLHNDIDTFILQAGVDGQFYESDSGRLIAGITGQYGNAHSSIDNRTGDGSGSIDTQGWGLGATATWYGNSGFYLDAQAQANWYDSNLGVDALNPTLTDSNKGFGYALSLEAGQRFALDQNWSLTPQAQLMFSSVDFDTFADTYDARISNRNGDSLTGRLGLAANYANSWKGEDGLMVNTSVYGIANLYQEFLGNARMNYAGTHMATDADGTWGGIGAGGTYAWADNKYAIYGEGSVNTSLNHFADSYSLKGTVGFKVKW